jgi:hypothetical protein
MYNPLSDADCLINNAKKKIAKHLKQRKFSDLYWIISVRTLLALNQIVLINCGHLSFVRVRVCVVCVCVYKYVILIILMSFSYSLTCKGSARLVSPVLRTEYVTLRFMIMAQTDRSHAKVE